MSQRVIGVFGGTFDPIHLAHLRMARAFVGEAGLSELRLIPTGDPYHRDQPAPAPSEHRLAMVRLAIANEAEMIADDREIRRLGQSYTIDTLEEIRAEIGGDVPLWFLIGADSLSHLDSWKRWNELFELANLAVAIRPGFSVDHLPAAIRKEWSSRRSSVQPSPSASGTILRLALPPLDLSASAIRDRLSMNFDISHLVPPGIATYIREHGLYR